MVVNWDTEEISEELKEYLQNNSTKINTILTFDEFGVSGHRNHISIHSGVK